MTRNMDEVLTITIPERITIKDLADKMKVQSSAVIKTLFMKGKMVTVNQEVKTYKFVSGNKVFYVTTYGKITSSVVVNPAEETTTHGGGSN